MNVDLYKYQSRNPFVRYLVANYFQVVRELYCQVKGELQSVIEIGCGEGFSTDKILEFVDTEVVLQACDVCQQSVELARNKCLKANVFRASIEGLHLQNLHYDLVFLLEVLEHLSNPEVALESLQKTSNQYLILGVPHEPIWRICNLMRLKYVADWGNTPGHLNFWNPKSLTNLVEKHFGPVLVCRQTFPWVIILAKNRKYEINNSNSLL